MDRNSVIGIVIIAIVLIGYSVLMKPSREEMEAQKRRADSLKQAQTEQMIEQQKEEQAAESKETDTTRTVETRAKKEMQKDMGIFAPRTVGKEEFYVLENDKIKLTISSRGGKPYSVQLKDYQTYDSLAADAFHRRLDCFRPPVFCRRTQHLHQQSLFRQGGRERSRPSPPTVR